MESTTRRLLGIMIVLATAPVALAQEEDGFLGILNGNVTLIDSVSNSSGTRTGDFSTKSLLGPTDNAQWQLDGPVVVSREGRVLGQLSTVDVSTTSLFNPNIFEQLPYNLRCEACIGSLNDSFSTEGPKIYDSQSSIYKSMLKEVFEYESVQR
jgi:hypothetical protein